MKVLTFALMFYLAAPILLAQEMKGMDTKGAKSDAKVDGQIHQSRGKVARIDHSAGTVTIAHEPVRSLNWTSMTMPFKLKDRAMFEKLKPNSVVDFSFMQSGKDYVITGIK